jgi:hypothetical protein
LKIHHIWKSPDLGLPSLDERDELGMLLFDKPTEPNLAHDRIDPAAFARLKLIAIRPNLRSWLNDATVGIPAKTLAILETAEMAVGSAFFTKPVVFGHRVSDFIWAHRCNMGPPVGGPDSLL